MESLLEVEVTPCRLLERVNRFTVEIIVDGRRELAHLTNTGRLTGILVSGRECLIQRINGKKMKYRVIGVRIGGEYALIDTVLQSRAFEILVERQLLPFLQGCRIRLRSPRVEGSVFDYLVECTWSTSYLVELKSAVMVGPNLEALYPDCPTERGRRHIKTLMKMAREKTRIRPMIVMVAAFKGASCFKPSRQGDPVVFSLLSSWILEKLDLNAFSLYLNREGSILLEKPSLPLCREWLLEAGFVSSS